MPSPPRHSWRSSAVPPVGAGPTAATDEVCTTRSTSARRHSSSSTRVVTTLASNSASALARRLVEPATWNTRVDAAQRPPQRPPVGQVGHDRLDLDAVERLEVRGRAAPSPAPSSPRATRARATCEPTNPVAPVTRVVGIAPRRLRHYAPGPWPGSPSSRTRRTTCRARSSRSWGCTRCRSTSPSRARPAREADITDLDDFYTRLSASSEMPSTSQPSVGDFLAVYEPLLDDGADIVSIHLSAGISGTFTAAEQARDQLIERGIDPARIVVLDSATACAGLGMMAIAAASAAQQGATPAGGRRGGPGAAARAQGVVRGRHARVPAPRRARRRRPGVARLDAEDQADPVDRVGDPAGRARAHGGAHVRAADRVPEGAPRRRQRHVLHPAHPRARPGPAAGRARLGDLRTESPSSCPRSAP